MDTNYMDTNHMELSPARGINGRALQWLGAGALVMLSFFVMNNASAQDADTIFACDTCDYQKAHWIAEQHIPAPSCVFTHEPGLYPTPDDVYCTSEYRTYIIANLPTEEAFKFRVHIPCYDTWCDYLSPVVQNLSLRADELADLQLFYDIDRDLRDAVNALNSGSAISLSMPSIPFTAQEQQVFATSSASASECVGSPVQYFTNADWRNSLRTTLAHEITQLAGNRTFGALTTTVGLGGFSLGRSQVGVSFQYHQGDLYVRRTFAGGVWQNSLHFKVEYRGNAYSGNISSVDLHFSLSASTSFIEGVEVATFIGGGRESFRHRSDIGCLGLLFNHPEFSEPVSESDPEWIPVDPFTPFAGSVERCAHTRTVYGCSTLPGGTRQCMPTTVTFWEMCSNTFP